MEPTTSFDWELFPDDELDELEELLEEPAEEELPDDDAAEVLNEKTTFGCSLFRHV